MPFPFSHFPLPLLYMFASTDTTRDVDLCSLASRLFITLFLSTKVDLLSKSVFFLKCGILSSLSLFMRRFYPSLCVWVGSAELNFHLLQEALSLSVAVWNWCPPFPLLPNSFSTNDLNLHSYQTFYACMSDLTNYIDSSGSRDFCHTHSYSPTKPAWTLHTMSYGFLITWEV